MTLGEFFLKFVCLVRHGLEVKKNNLINIEKKSESKNWRWRNDKKTFQIHMRTEENKHNFLFGRNIEAEFEKISNISFIVFLIAIGNINIYKCARLILLRR